MPVHECSVSRGDKLVLLDLGTMFFSNNSGNHFSRNISSSWTLPVLNQSPIRPQTPPSLPLGCLQEHLCLVLKLRSTIQDIFPHKMFHLTFPCGLLPLKFNPQPDVPDYLALSVLPDEIMNILTQ